MLHRHLLLALAPFGFLDNINGMATGGFYILAIMPTRPLLMAFGSVATEGMVMGDTGVAIDIGGVAVVVTQVAGMGVVVVTGDITNTSRGVLTGKVMVPGRTHRPQPGDASPDVWDRFLV